MAVASQSENLDNILGNAADFIEVLRVLDDTPNLRIPAKQANALREATLTTFEKALEDWNDAMAEEDARNQSEDEKELTDLLNNATITKAERGRMPCINGTVAFAFHVLVFLNFMLCFFESYLIIVEKAKLDYMFLHEMFQCLRIPEEQDRFFHYINIFYALCCVVVLHAKTKKTANLCWAFLVGCSLHFYHRLYGILFHIRFEYGKRLREKNFSTVLAIVIFLLVIEIPSVLIVLLRYYDLTQRFEGRAHEFATKTYDGRQLNDKIIYNNVSSFLQRKFVLRSCTSLQIFSTVNKILSHKRKLKKGQTISEEVVDREVRAAVAAFKEVEHLRGMEMLRELKRRQYTNLNDADLLFYDEEEVKQGETGNLGDDEAFEFQGLGKKSGDIEELFDLD